MVFPSRCCHSPSKSSHVRGDETIPLIEAPIGHYFENLVSRFGDREVIHVVHQGIRWSWKQLNEQVDAFAHGMIEMGLKKGDRIGIWMPNGKEWLIAQLATAKTGIILVNLNPAYRLHELEHAINLVEMKAIILASQFKESNYVNMMLEIAPELKECSPGKLKSKRLPSLQHVIQSEHWRVNGVTHFSDHLIFHPNSTLKNELKRMKDSLQCDEAINIQFTSGTTGLPKGATLSHKNLLNNGFFVGERMKFTEKDKLCLPVPLYHCFGLVLGNLAAMTHGASLVYPSAGFDALSTLSAVEKERCTALHGVPTMFIAELNHPEFSKFDLSSLRTGIMAGSPCPKEVMIQVIQKMNMKDITICYGMTETSPVSFQTMSNDPIDKRVETVGKIHPHVEVKIVDIDGSGTTVERTISGELWTKGYNVMIGYWNNSAQTRESIVDGWMKTGDLATLDEDGYCRIVGRIKDTIIRGGENIFPREVEEYLYSHPDVEDVQICGVPDTKYGEELCAWIRLKSGKILTERDIKQFCQGKIAHYKIPRYVLFVEDFPVTVTGKIQKFKMRQESITILGLEKERQIFS